jgi:hypothetical protein
MWSWQQGWQGRECREHDPSGSAGERSAAPAPAAEESLQVLASGDEERLAVDLLQPSQSEASQPVPGLGLGEERFDPDLPFAHGLLVGLTRLIAADPRQIRFIEVPRHLAPLAALCALRLEGASVARLRRRLVDPQSLRVPVLAEPQRLAARAVEDVLLSVVGER